MSERPRVAVVTGAGCGIGGAIATRLADDGYFVAIVDRKDRLSGHVAETINAVGGRSIELPADVRFAHQAEAVVAQVTDLLGAPAVLVNNVDPVAGRLMVDMSEQDWDTATALHLRATFLMSRAVLRFMMAAGGGRIVNVSSGLRPGQSGWTHVTAAVLGLHGLTRALATEVNPFGITVNAVTAEPDEDPAPLCSDISDRQGITDEVATCVGFLVSESGRFLSGQVLDISAQPGPWPTDLFDTKQLRRGST